MTMSNLSVSTLFSHNSGEKILFDKKTLYFVYFMSPLIICVLHTHVFLLFNSRILDNTVWRNQLEEMTMPIYQDKKRRSILL